MGWFIAAVAITAKTLVVAAGAVAAIGLVAYGIYKVDQYMTDSSHKHKEGRKKGAKMKSVDLKVYEDVKPRTQDTELRRRNADSNLGPENDQVVAPLNNLSVMKCHQETQATSLNNLSITKNQGTQTDEVLLTRVDLPSLNIAAENSIADDEVNNVTSNGAESVYSFDSTSSGSSTTRNIPKWSEMSNEEKYLCKCAPCGRIVTTVTYPCKHPYFCSECAPVLFKFYHRCPKCSQRIKSYDHV